MSEKTALRTDNKQSNLQVEHVQGIQHIQTQLDQFIKVNDAKIQNMHNQRVIELRELLTKKMRIERQMIHLTNELQASYEDSKQLLEVVLNGRIADCDDSLKELSTIIADTDSEDVEKRQES